MKLDCARLGTAASASKEKSQHDASGAPITGQPGNPSSASAWLLLRYNQYNKGPAYSMLVLRSLTFSILFYLFFAVSAVAATAISLFLPRSLPPFARFWSRAWLAMYRAICGVTYEVRGTENIPHGGCLLAVKHQSVWDTCALFAIFDRPVFVLKSELMFIPFFGWALARLGCIPVKR
ncbi:MAG TPA: 1-acyl-sn-glycerol-3-phosphate acyltransferase, partial [Steroidobacteraceae bacterium]|nr:1-acyl-sn-glycerol-3-phosphate acyltransferase [Steroidobacteraceae bacterium]